MNETKEMLLDYREHIQYLKDQNIKKGADCRLGRMWNSGYVTAYEQLLRRIDGDLRTIERSEKVG